MAVISCADVEVLTGGQRHIYNCASVEEGDFTFLESIWPIYCNGRTLHKVTEMPTRPDYPTPPDINWLEDEDGFWFNPAYNPPTTDD